MPKDNEPNLQDLPESIRGKLKIHTAGNVGEVLERLLLAAPEQPVSPPPTLSKPAQPGAPS